MPHSIRLKPRVMQIGRPRGRSVGPRSTCDADSGASEGGHKKRCACCTSVSSQSSIGVQEAGLGRLWTQQESQSVCSMQPHMSGRSLQLWPFRAELTCSSSDRLGCAKTGTKRRKCRGGTPLSCRHGGNGRATLPASQMGSHKDGCGTCFIGDMPCVARPCEACSCDPTTRTDNDSDAGSVARRADDGTTRCSELGQTTRPGRGHLRTSLHGTLKRRSSSVELCDDRNASIRRPAG